MSLVLLILLLVVFGSFVISFISGAILNLKIVSNVSARKVVFYAAESGIAYGEKHIFENNGQISTGFNPTQKHYLSNGSYFIVDIDYDKENIFVNSKGFYDDTKNVFNLSREIQATFRSVGFQEINSALVSGGDMILKGSTTIKNSDIASNNNVYAQGNFNIINGKVGAKESTYGISEDHLLSNFKGVVLPEIDWEKIRSENDGILEKEEGHIKKGKEKNGHEIYNIEEQNYKMYYPGTIQHNGQTLIHGSGVLYIDGDLEVGGGSIIGKEEDQLVVIVNGDFKSNGNISFNTTVIAKDNIDCRGKVEGNGSLISGGEIYLQGSVNFDGSHLEQDIEETIHHFERINWKEIL
ncbi:MAG: hypothetical protein ACOCQR_01595 [bacterium]